MNIKTLIFVSLNIGALGLAVACGESGSDSPANSDGTGGSAGAGTGGDDSAAGGMGGGSGGSVTGGSGGSVTGGSGGTGGTPNVACGNVDLGQSETRTRYAAAEVPAGEECESEEQSRTCEAEGFSEWSGTFAAETCVVQTPDGSCGATENGGEEERTRYEAATVPYGSSCVSEVQARTCTDGNWGDFSGTFTADSCSVDAPASCGDVAHGTSDERVRYEAATVDFGATCVQETQTALCDNGELGEWSGTFTFGACTVGPAADCENGIHGEVLERTRYQSATVPYGETCVKETQTQTCNDGTWEDWTGTYAFESCTVEEPADCVDGEHGDTKERTRFMAASVSFGETCQSEVQTQSCTNGIWSDWTGTYAEVACSAAPPASCDGVAHLGTQARTRYQTASVPNGNVCNGEAQSRSCFDGTWGNWSGSYTFESCTVDAPFAGSCTLSLNGEVYACTDAVGSAYTAPITCSGTYSASHCPSNADLLGYCKLKPGGLAQYEQHLYYYESAVYPDDTGGKQYCSIQGGTWVP
jgi:hypothetical protein